MITGDSFPAAVPEIPVEDVDAAAGYYENRLGFTKNWGGSEGGIGQVSRGACRLFLSGPEFRAGRRNKSPAVFWLNVDSRDAVDAIYSEWSRRGAEIRDEPRLQTWKLYEFTAADADGNILRVFYDTNWETGSGQE